ncbi:MAG: hypothetical protein A3I00_05805 [Betaproteobacteria bacterium RIFCSPLOWO2_02_FULL_64_12]|nr:MAG: hypothetical protein A3I00_05805 [Betaproteobacteria bacterium RIFCSPLOWO2_02_FULL_64_12]
MYRAYMTALLVVVLLLTSAGTASAECAWVLWIAYDSSGQRTWHIFASFPGTVGDMAGVGWLACDKALKERALPMLARQPELKNTFAVCLPDTVDPRGPKVR